MKEELVKLLTERRGAAEENRSHHFSREVIPLTWYSQQINSEIDQLQRILADRELDVVVEIGSAEGGTCALWAMIAKLVISIDFNHNRTKMYDGVSDFDGKIIQIESNSHAHGLPEKIRDSLHYQEVDLLFIDGDHTHDGAEQDFCMYKQLVRKDGVIALHDITRLLPELWYNLARTYPITWEIKHRVSDNGIGIIKYDPGIMYKAKYWRG